jgi:flagellar protein FlgJ
MGSTLTNVATLGKQTPGYDKLHQQAKDLEGVFLNTLTKEMFSSVKTDDKSFGGGFGEETWRGMQAEQFATAISNAGGVGLADQMMGSLLELQESAQAGMPSMSTLPPTLSIPGAAS